MIISGRAQSESATVYQVILEHGHCNYRTIMKKTGLPINHVVRAINTLTSGSRGIKLAEVSHVANDPESGRLVQHYQVVHKSKLELA